ncbi:ATP-dependent DNA helicase RecG [Corynebacterium pseudotuberculosis]|uniref:DEAD/DEAH box helicase n=1 Tax=Corynebacterium pseudotuberculosis (strain C231) TaxID=681645 RepID=D9QA22_CORP2|nr:ATP-dependent DNA helicase RecG [Corynebacterium pseudotuberculosis]ADK28714.1 DEAD/DEAH box helicase [Corynebacterium pseudotuberculosis FRC41]ADL10398.1 DEAD/DEAH box helicase [Corynebacterium pseudotuberculosis C231]ADL20801.1 ATP-dependent DNA helicase RecG [Corynebacterium pseudotuberculosis 1002]ADO26191.1 DEAD/DEAH box helicase [Corynebacterium pseudotuberculosis I19]AEP70167.1 ATP-dependent DNA helicase [Corynebacterium pseudotuberculosis 42/02-A]
MLGWHDTRPLTQLLPEKEAKAFARHFGYRRAEDLLMHLPRAYAAHGAGLSAGHAQEGDIITCIGDIVSTSERRDRNGNLIYTVEISDGAVTTTATFFRANWLSKVLVKGARGMFTGKLKFFREKSQLQHPDFFLFPDPGTKTRSSGGLQALSTTGEFDHVTHIINSLAYIPVYPAKKAMPTWRILGAIHEILSKTPPIVDPLGNFKPDDMPTLDQAIRGAHETDCERAEPYINRLKYNEALSIALVMALRRADMKRRQAFPMPASQTGLRATLLKALPFQLTEGQQQVAQEIEEDLGKNTPMSRLLQGEVGSGKTIVSLIAMLQAVDAHKQCALLAPTEVLATQHAHSIRATLAAANIQLTVVLLTGSLSTAERKKALLDIMSGDADIIIGTHALIQDTVNFYDLGLCVVDEQHRFGVEQRDYLRAKGNSELTPHLLVMTATPIPRTIAMTAFGDLSVSTLRQLPGGRRPIKTFVISSDNPTWSERMWKRIREEVERGQQIYVVCPRVKNNGGVEETTASLQHGIFSDLRVEMLHGSMHPDDKETIMAAFATGTIDVLVATTVIEVGIDVPNATIMLIREAENFGVSQLHQLRGRVGRGGKESICFLHTTAEPDTPARQRIQKVAATADGFALAEIDLEYRQEGDILGTQQSGASQKRISFIQDKALIQRANDDAAAIVQQNPNIARSLVSDIDDHSQDYLDKT